MVACKDAHNLPVGRNFRTVHEVVTGGRMEENGAWRQDVRAFYLPVSCIHCDDPACVKTCPTKAHYKRKEDGLDLIDKEKCIGCGMCAAACPYHAPVLDQKVRKMTKCDACVDRHEKGHLPICVESCPQRAIAFGPIDELRARYGANAASTGLPDPGLTKPNLVVGLPKSNS